MKNNNEVFYNNTKDYYDKLFSAKTKEEIEEIKTSELYKYFKKELGKRQKGETLSLPSIDVSEIMIVEYLEMFNYIDSGFDYFIIKGSRGSAKSTSVIQFVLIDMISDNQASWICIMEQRVQHSDSTMIDFEKWINEIDKIWYGFKELWTKTDSQTSKRWTLRMNGHEQIIKFIGLDEASKGTTHAPVGGYWSGYWVEEPVSSDEQFGADQEKKSEKYKALVTLEGSCSRSMTILPMEIQKKKKFLKIFTFNPYNEEDELLKGHNELLPDNREELSINGFQMLADEETKKVYMTTNYRINPFLGPAFLTFMERTRLLGGEDEKVLNLGMTGSPINTAYSDIIWKLNEIDEKPKIHNVKGYCQFINFMILIDIGNGGKGQMVIGLFGKTYDGTWIPLDEWGSYKSRHGKQFDSEKEIFKLWNVIKKWNDHYVDFSKMSDIPIIMDYDIHFFPLFKNGFKEIDAEWNTSFRVSMFSEKYKQVWENTKRPRVVKYLITTGMIEPYKAYTPQFISQIKSTKFDKNGKIMDGNDDFRNMFEMGIFHIAREIGLKKLNEGKLLDKDMIAFVKGL